MRATNGTTTENGSGMNGVNGVNGHHASASSSGIKQRVLVTGGAGYIGSHVVVTLLLSGKYQPIVVDNFHNSKPHAIQACEDIALEALGSDASQEEKDRCHVDLIKGDISDPAVFDGIFQRYSQQGGIYAVIHVAALKAVGESGELPLLYYQVNVSATINLIQSMIKYKCLNLVYSSSATVYGTPETIPIPETSPVQPESVYGRSKGMCEDIIKDVCLAERSFNAVSLRYFNPAGAHPSGKMGEDPRGKPGNLLPLLAAIAVGRYAQDGLKVFGDDYPTHDGTCVRDYLHVMDLAKGHVLSLDALEKAEIFKNCGKTGNCRAFNLGHGKGQSVLDMIEAMRKASGYQYKYDIVERRMGDVPDLTADPTLAERELGFLAKEDLDSMCRDLWRWQSSHPNGYDQ
ncbi:hypothetical protein NliqN6_5181 [Naganishia liquefaciens]|uniref:NAD(P)-binding domain-containing protein n=1 Tax=Naganishia liquefaciens TaxID=104408 RepID=A0A8H3YGI3_9TREE|nr:hypothetical protein NliqN6_5181 [Naganishia liquefaciens]